MTAILWFSNTYFYLMLSKMAAGIVSGITGRRNNCNVFAWNV